MNQGCRLERVTWSLSRHLVRRQPAKFFVDQRQ